MFTRTLYLCLVLLQIASLSVETGVWVLCSCNTERWLNSVPLALCFLINPLGLLMLEISSWPQKPSFTNCRTPHWNVTSWISAWTRFTCPQTRGFLYMLAVHGPSGWGLKAVAGAWATGFPNFTKTGVWNFHWVLDSQVTKYSVPESGSKTSFVHFVSQVCTSGAVILSGLAGCFHHAAALSHNLESTYPHTSL